MKKMTLYLCFSAVLVTILGIVYWRNDNQTFTAETMAIAWTQPAIVEEYSVNIPTLVEQLRIMGVYHNFEILDFSDMEMLEMPYFEYSIFPNSTFNTTYPIEYIFYDWFNFYITQFFLERPMRMGYDLNTWEGLINWNNAIIHRIYLEYNIAINEEYISYLIFSSILNLRNRLLYELNEGLYQEIFQEIVSAWYAQDGFALHGLTVNPDLDLKGLTLSQWLGLFMYSVFYNTEEKFDINNYLHLVYENIVLNHYPTLGLENIFMFDDHFYAPNVFMLRCFAHHYSPRYIGKYSENFDVLFSHNTRLYLASFHVKYNNILFLNLLRQCF